LDDSGLHLRQNGCSVSSVASIGKLLQALDSSSSAERLSLGKAQK